MTDTLTPLVDSLRQLIVDTCEKDLAPESIGADEALFGPHSRLALDSLDALQLSMALQKRYGVRLTDSKETRRVMASVAVLAAWLQSQGAERT